MFILVEKTRDDEFYDKKDDLFDTNDEEIWPHEDEDEEAEHMVYPAGPDGLKDGKIPPDGLDKRVNIFQLIYEYEEDVYQTQVQGFFIYFDRTREEAMLFDKDELKFFQELVKPIKVGNQKASEKTESIIPPSKDDVDKEQKA